MEKATKKIGRKLLQSKIVLRNYLNHTLDGDQKELINILGRRYKAYRRRQ